LVCLSGHFFSGFPFRERVSGRRPGLIFVAVARAVSLIQLARASSISLAMAEEKGVGGGAEKLTVDQLQDVRDTLKKPLTGRKVLVPFGRKAFFPGTLQPSVRDGEELVRVREGGGTAVKDMTRQEALNRLQKEMDGLKMSQRKPSPSMSKDAAAPPSKPAAQQKEEATGHALPFFEIREELNESGQEVKAEAVNISKHLEYLQKKEAGALDDKVPSDVVRRPVEEPTNETAAMLEQESEATPLQPLSDSEYDALSTRLDELAQLEEESGRQKTVNVKSAKKLQSKGWSKGFLNKKQKTKQPKTQQKSEPNRSEPEMKRPAIIPESEGPSKDRKVAFGVQDEVREIPRVGERSVSSLPKPASRPIETSVFSGTVQEKRGVPEEQKPAPKKRLSRFAQERQQLR
jgi:hypothetical protein